MHDSTIRTEFEHHRQTRVDVEGRRLGFDPTADCRRRVDQTPPGFSAFNAFEARNTVSATQIGE
ncbi:MULTISPECIES: hypothetical protein [Rhodococcus]|jgi:hypothetical protein|uniref:Uncharacterized protein n=1 Tax=Rhodococcus oxybenzonivorans TaxID=1990687 RepID=A0AAE5A9E6_9NOCA|nr:MULTISPECIES: hypothetical protein [Rhodococcus]MDV7240837.1 hypothetical protein [Rhodococcus oxybenzonivorans]MDV7268955.1 hypothetical protein [Rhodococcus oxybenzonivorans]MDV7273110.1 hypothetical protein [Rhodococcus oxybenzonivorans]MDV7333152.1 hypothetical protein [Rhodococcus oxybenzonivorans]MDV7342318.1 hypothetical protein [Rhodococcus oxybenzonivorans]